MPTKTKGDTSPKKMEKWGEECTEIETHPSKTVGEDFFSPFPLHKGGTANHGPKGYKCENPVHLFFEKGEDMKHVERTSHIRKRAKWFEVKTGKEKDM